MMLARKCAHKIRPLRISSRNSVRPLPARTLPNWGEKVKNKTGTVQIPIVKDVPKKVIKKIDLKNYEEF